MGSDVQFSGPEITTIILRGKEYRIGPMKVGGRRRIIKAMMKLPRPKPVVVDVQGLVEGMLRAAEEEAGDADKIKRAMLVEKIRVRTLAEVVLQAIREARAVVEIWPPDPTDFRGMKLIADNADIFQEFVFTILSANNPGFTMDQAARMAGNVEGAEEESLTVNEQGEMFSIAVMEPRIRQADKEDREAAAQEDADIDEGAGPKS